MITVALDPGVRTGYAVFDGKRLTAAGTWKVDHEKMLRSVVQSYPPDSVLVVIEEPGAWGWKGRMSSKSQATFNRRIGAYRAIAEMSHAKAELIPVSKWKGNKPKEKVIQSIGLIYGPVLGELTFCLDDNAWEAIGLGHYAVSRISAP